MLWDSYREVQTPRGTFRLELCRPGWATGSSSRRVATREEAELAWSRLAYDLEHLSFGEAGGLLELYAELTGERVAVTGVPRDPALLQRLRDALKRGLECGWLRFEAEENRDPLGEAELEYVRLDPQRLKPAPANAKETHFIEFQLLDQDKEGVPGRHYRVLQGDRVVREGKTDRDGWARADSLDPDSSKIEFDDCEPIAWAYEKPLPGKALAEEPTPVKAPPIQTTPEETKAAADQNTEEKKAAGTALGHFEVRLVDELDQAIPGVEVQF